ncbi:MAG: hypothetical protein LBF72_03705 [Holosporales bacterium]|jgi:hypothetical protein|nr:hypothetical protein [Holosporales bacterium]
MEKVTEAVSAAYDVASAVTGSAKVVAESVYNTCSPYVPPVQRGAQTVLDGVRNFAGLAVSAVRETPGAVKDIYAVASDGVVKATDAAKDVYSTIVNSLP